MIKKYTYEGLKKKAVELFTIHPNIDRIYMTVDGQGFTEEHRAESNTHNLTEKEVYKFDRYTTPAVLPHTVSQEDREQLFDEYAELFGKTAPHNITNEKLVEKITEFKNENPKNQ